MVLMLTTEGQASRVLTAYTDVLVERGTRGATLEEVARRAGLSKAGVLHHFASMRTLRSTLLHEVRAQAQADVEVMQNAPEGPLRYYLVTSLQRDSELERVIEACTRIAQTGDQEALDVLRESRKGWLDLLQSATGNSSLSRMILMIGDGINYNSLLRLERDEQFLTEELLDDILELLGRISD